MKLLILSGLLSLVTSLALAEKYDCRNISNIGFDSNLSEKTSVPVETLLKMKFRGNRLIVSKEDKRLFVFHDDTLLRVYDVALGRNPYGPKTFSGDNKTPEGKYVIDYKNRESEYHLSLHISYPNSDDLARNKKYNELKETSTEPGGDIMIHGLPNNESIRTWVEKGHPFVNWTRGCIAITNAEIEELFQLVPQNSQIEICPAKGRKSILSPLELIEKI